MLNLLKKLNNQKNILVVGDIMVDYFTYCKPIKKSAEVDINVCNIINEEYSLGGAANVWNNIKGFDVNCILCGAIGKDTFGDFVETNINDNNLIIYNEKTTTKHRFYENNKQVFRIDQDIICNFSNSVRRHKCFFFIYCIYFFFCYIIFAFNFSNIFISKR